MTFGEEDRTPGKARRVFFREMVFRLEGIRQGNAF